MASDAGNPTKLIAGRVNVRTGCIVCKIRKVKCDEQRPFCARCISTGRKCDGYVDPPPIHRSSHSTTYAHASKSLSIYSPSLDASEDAGERRSSLYFRSRMLQDISSCFDADFWNYLVLQVCQVEPAVRHALFALSSLYEAYDLNRNAHKDLASNEAEPCKRFALQQYTKAVGLLANNSSTEQPSVQAILISCVVFVWIEFLQNNLDEALRHLQGGLQILKDSQASPALPHIDASLPRLFIRLHSQGRIHGSPTSNFNSTIPEKRVNIFAPAPYAFSGILEARNWLDCELDSIYTFMRQMYDPSFVTATRELHPFPDPLSLEATTQSHLHNLQTWQTASQNMPFLSSNPPEAKQLTGLYLLQLQHTNVSIMLKNFLKTSEMVYDNYTSDFELILSLAEHLINSPPHSGLPVLSFDIGVLPSLFLVTLKCRIPSIRRKAIALLKQAPEREGIWQRAAMVEYAEFKFEREERGRGELPETSPLPESARITGERGREAVVEGRRVTILTYKRGGGPGPNGEGEIVEEILEMIPTMGELV